MSLCTLSIGMASTLTSQGTRSGTTSTCAAPPPSQCAAPVGMGGHPCAARPASLRAAADERRRRFHRGSPLSYRASGRHLWILRTTSRQPSQRFARPRARPRPGRLAPTLSAHAWAKRLSLAEPELRRGPAGPAHALSQVRLKRFLEMRGADCGSRASILALPAFWVRRP